MWTNILYNGTVMKGSTLYNRLSKKDLLCFSNVIVKRLGSFPCFFSPKDKVIGLKRNNDKKEGKSMYGHRRL